MRNKTASQPGNSNSPIWIAYFVIMFINKLLCLKIKAFTFNHGLNRGIRLSPSEINMQNSVLQALLACIRLIQECIIYSFTPVISALFGVF